MRERFSRVNKLIKHKIAYSKVEKDLLGKNTIKSITHDLDKLLLLMFVWIISVKNIRKLHKKYAKHHQSDFITDDKIVTEKVIDYECARLTKPHSPLTAIQYINHKCSRVDLEKWVLLAKCEELGLKE